MKLIIVLLAFVSRFIHKNSFLYDTNDYPPKSDVLQHAKSNIYSRLRRSTFNTSGIDERYENMYKEEEGNITDICNWIRQQKLLKKLENSNISEMIKLAEIDEYNRIFEPSKISSNLEAGGLFDDWNFADTFEE
jgi:hypothetical protein